ncbi:MAG: 3-phosphoshikimate 1-carboxyvinyltransferase [Bacteroidales bacterium]|jgi:3-phosphoshikimate 1-carboxyvinyltransferase|nr:3-phosphoshikimate 1-carboxyvinyltransferase [Bacteroidales bacterium]
MKYMLSFPHGKLQGRISLPSSKSISNRLLIIRALTSGGFPLEGLSGSDDTQVLQQGLQSASDVIDIGHAGTSMRFLTAYFAATGQAKTITGSERMKNRPISGLVDALDQLGAGIRYLEKPGYPPLRTSGKPLSGNSIEINGNVSSQFISAMLLVAPALPNGLIIRIKGELVSASYVKMTLGLMQQAGIDAIWENNAITVARQDYRSEGMSVERDWSAASYWYQMAALATDAELLLEGLTGKSLQGDAIISQMACSFGIKTEYTPEGALLTRHRNICFSLGLDFMNVPDLVQTMAVTCCLNNTRFRFAGVQTLRVKETDRIAALQSELLKLGYCLKETEPGVIEWNRERVEPQQPACISTYHDHRMAMAFAPAAIHFPGLQIEDPGVVSKSYPNFWNDLKKTGLVIMEQR